MWEIGKVIARKKGDLCLRIFCRLFQPEIPKCQCRRKTGLNHGLIDVLYFRFLVHTNFFSFLFKRTQICSNFVFVHGICERTKHRLSFSMENLCKNWLQTKNNSFSLNTSFEFCVKRCLKTYKSVFARLRMLNVHVMWTVETPFPVKHLCHICSNVVKFIFESDVFFMTMYVSIIILCKYWRFS